MEQEDWARNKYQVRSNRVDGRSRHKHEVMDEERRIKGGGKEQ